MGAPMKVLLGAAAVGAVAVALSVYVLREPVDLPEPQVHVHKEVFPDLDFRAAAPGSSIDRIYRGFGRQPPDAEGHVAGRRCIYFRYDPELFEGALALLGNGAIVEKRWVIQGSAKPQECSGLPEESVDLRGWYAAAVR